MGILGKGDKSKSRVPGTTVISSGTRLDGELSLESNLHIDGQIKGTILSEHDVSIGQSGRFEGNLKAERLLVSGFVEGVIDCASLEIVAEGRVFGELHSDDFVIEPGGHFLGRSHPRRDAPLVGLGHERESEPKLAPPAEEPKTEPERETVRAAPTPTPPPPPNTPTNAGGGGEVRDGDARRKCFFVVGWVRDHGVWFFYVGPKEGKSKLRKE